LIVSELKSEVQKKAVGKKFAQRENHLVLAAERRRIGALNWHAIIDQRPPQALRAVPKNGLPAHRRNAMPT
jgi:hypothetical protein